MKGKGCTCKELPFYEGKCRVIVLHKKSKNWAVTIMEPRTVNRDPKGRGKIPCLMIGANYIPKYLERHNDVKWKDSK